MARRRSVKFADSGEVEQFAHKLKAPFLYCRELGHKWRPFAARYVSEQRAYERILRCTSCYTERHQVLDSAGHIISNHYRHPEGYLHKGMGRIVGEGRDVLRLESLTRFIESAGNREFEEE